MNARFKTFGDISELTPREQDELSMFHSLNNTIEQNKTIPWYQDIVREYSEAILNIWEDGVEFSGYWELYFQIKYLLEEKNQTNSILSFAEKKYKLIEAAIAELLEIVWPLSKEKSLEVFNIMSHCQEWNIVFKICDRENNQLEKIYVPFNLNLDFQRQYIEMKEKIHTIGNERKYWECIINLEIQL